MFTVGAEAVPTVTTTPAEVTTMLFESVARAVNVLEPVFCGVQLTLYGAKLSVPIVMPFSRNSTPAIVLPGLAVALAVTLTGTPTFTVEPAVGAVMETVAADGPTVTLTGLDTRALELLSTAIAVMEYDLIAPGVHVTEYGAAVSGLPICSPSAKKVTLVTLPPASGSDAVADTVTLLPTAITSLGEGAVIETVGPFSTALATLISTGLESKVAPLLPVACAVNVYVPGLPLNVANRL
jgi:hypothetical protein